MTDEVRTAPPSPVVISGASGLLGGALRPALESRGHQVEALVRRAADKARGEIAWDPQRGTIDAAALEGCDAVVHLAGENVAAGRWTEERKRALWDSRVKSTEVLCRALAGLARKPRVLVAASAIGIYGDRGDEVLTEASAPASGGFLPDLCRAWEAASQPALEAGIRVVNLRIGVVLTPRGGALRKLLTPFKLGLGGVVGSGRQYWSWIGLADLVAAVRAALENEALEGPVNAVAPEPATNRQFTKTLGRVLRRPTLLPLPAAAVRLAFGEMGQALLLEGARVLPARLQAAGFAFEHPDLESALRAELAEGAPRK